MTALIEIFRKFIFLPCILLISLYSKANSYCSVPYGYPTHGLDHRAVSELVHDVPANAIWECGLMNNLRKFESGHTEEPHYKNAFILLDKKDFSFVSLKKVDGYTIFGGTDSDGQTYYIAMEPDVTRLKMLIDLATIVKISELKDFIFEDGSRHYLPIVKKVVYIH